MFVGSAIKRLLDPRKRARRAFDDVPDMLIRALVDGTRARVTGTVSSLHPLRPSPVDQRPSVRLRLQGVENMVARESCQAFSISDETGTAIVEGPFMMSLDGDRSYVRFREAMLLPGDRVTVLGTVSITIDPAGEPSGFRDPPTLRRIVGTDQEPVVLSDAAGDPA
jgi:hypothetical protein